MFMDFANPSILQ